MRHIRLHLKGISFNVALLFLLIGLPWACGRKAPPVPPQRRELPQVTELKGNLSGDTVTLLWPAAPLSAGIRDYAVLRAQSDPSKPTCPGCPMIFQRVATRPAAPNADQMEYSEQVADGYVYTYKVQPVGIAGEPGPDSNAVVIDRSSR